MSEDEDQQYEQLTVHGACKEAFTAFHANVRGFKTNGVRVEGVLKRMAVKPGLVLLNETLIDESHVLELHGYEVVCRKDGSRLGRHRRLL